MKNGERIAFTFVNLENVGACDGYNGPDFRSVLPKKDSM